MRPIKLVMQAFGPYAGCETVDFDKLSKAGIFLIKGPTGSGKTTIFDAMSMALYGKSTGEDDKSKIGRNDLLAWKSVHAAESPEVKIEFTFEAEGKEYCFSRRLLKKRINYDKSVSVTVKNEDGIQVPLFENPKESDLAAKAEELIGLNADQFRQVVLLPQGKFERFLVANASEKEEILKRLFNAGLWGRYADRFYEKADERRKALTEEKRLIDASLSDEPEQFETVDALSGHIELLKGRLKTLDADFAAFEIDEKTKLLDAEIALAEKFKQLHMLEAQKSGLEAGKGSYDMAKERLKRAHKADGLRELMNSARKAKAEHKKRSERVEALRKLTAGYEQTMKESAEALSQHKAASPIDANNARLGELSSKEAVYTQIDELFEAGKDAAYNLRAAGAKYNAAKEQANIIKKRAAEDLNSYNVEVKNAALMRESFFAGIYGEIASELRDGEACPVCGSTVHPAPARKNADSVSKADVDKAEADADAKKKAWESSESSRQVAEKELEALLEECNKRSLEAEKANAKYESAKSGLIEGIGNLDALRTTIAALKAQNEAYAKEAAVLEAKNKEAAEQLQAHLANIDIAVKEENDSAQALAEAENVLCTTLTEKGYAGLEDAEADIMSTQDITELQNKVSTYETEVRNNIDSLAQMQEALKESAEPDADSFADRRAELTDKRESYTKEHTRLTGEIKRLGEKAEKLSYKARHYAENIQEAESDWTFAKGLRGDAGIGLQRYVLGIMFDQVILEANRMLTKVHNGRYQLYRTDDKGAGNKRGLELIAHDSACPGEKGRAVSMLSGGEKFLVSLALSIGMSAVAQRSGLKIEALFIDEGFGTLDDSSINDAMDVLKSVQRSNGMIGIISHVELLESIIPDSLEVIKSVNGSTIKMC